MSLVRWFSTGNTVVVAGITPSTVVSPSSVAMMLLISSAVRIGLSKLPCVGFRTTMSVSPMPSQMPFRMLTVMVSPTAKDAEMMVVASISPTTISTVCAGRRGRLRSDRRIRNRLPTAMMPITTRTIARAPSMMYAKVLICAPNRVSMV